jgi:hypothetical protein
VLIAVALNQIRSMEAQAASKSAACKDCPFPITILCVRDPDGSSDLLRCRQANSSRTDPAVREINVMTCTTGGFVPPVPLEIKGKSFPLQCYARP